MGSNTFQLTRVAMLVVAGWLLLATPAHAQTVYDTDIPATADADVLDTTCTWDRVFDSATMIGDGRTGVIWFSGLEDIPANAEITSATLSGWSYGDYSPANILTRGGAGITNNASNCMVGATQTSQSHTWLATGFLVAEQFSITLPTALIQEMIDTSHHWLTMTSTDGAVAIYSVEGPGGLAPTLSITYTTPAPAPTVTPIMTPIATPAPELTGTIDFNYGGLPPLPEPFELSTPEHEIEMDWAWDMGLITNVFRIIRTIPLVVANMPGWSIVMYAVLVLLSLRMMLRVAGFIGDRRRAAERLEQQLQDEVDSLSTSSNSGNLR